MSSEVFQKAMARHVVPNRNIHTLKLSHTCGDAFRLFNEKNIVAAPVIDPLTEVFIGFISLHDFIIYITDIFLEGDPETESTKKTSLDRQIFYETPLYNVLSYTQTGLNSQELIVFPNTPLFDLMQKLCTGRVRRLACLDVRGRVINMITQHDVLQFLVWNSVLIRRKLTETLSQAGLIKPVIAMKKTDPLWKVLKSLAKTDVRGIPIVDEEGKIVANFSESEFKYISENSMRELDVSVYDFLVKRLSKPFPEEKFEDFRQMKTSVNPITCPEHFTIDYVLQMLVACKIHRIWIVDDEKRPVGVVSEPDVIKALIFDNTEIIPKPHQELSLPPPSFVSSSASSF